jgi:Tol biopolymer transport system component
MENGYWTEPKEFSFCPARKDRYPFFSPDGKRLFFNSGRNITTSPDKSSTGIWYVERENEGWSEPQQIDFGEDYQGGTGIFPSVAANGNLYFALWPTRENGFIYMSRYENGKYSSPERLGSAINDKGGNHPYIAPDESYIIFDDNRSEDNFGQLDLFISFRDKNGKWMKVQNLGEGVNTVYGERRPFVSFDGKYLFFSSDRINPELPDRPISLKELQQLTNVHANGYQNIYWVDAKLIEELKPNKLK